MKELTCLPNTSELEVRIGSQMALSQLFAAGGENLEQTLTLLTQAYSRWISEMKSAGTDLTLAQLTEAVELEKNDELAYEFNRLFVGPASPSAPPYESVYRTEDRLVMQETTLAVREWYRAEKLSTTSISNEPDDFIATELEFAAYLLSCALGFYQRNQRSLGLEYLQKYNTFYQEHLGLWLPGFVQEFSSSTTSQLFKIVGKILIQTVTSIHQGEGGLS